MLNTRQITIDNEQPEVSLIAPIEGGSYRGRLSFKASSSDTGSGVRQVSFGYPLNGTEEWIDGTKDGDGNWTAYLDTINILNDGTYAIHVRSTDFAGKTTMPRPFTVTIDNTVPQRYYRFSHELLQ